MTDRQLSIAELEAEVAELRRQLHTPQTGPAFVPLSVGDDRFQILADHVPVLIWMAGADMRCSYFNRPWLEFRGRTLEQELGTGWVEGIHPDDRERFRGVFASAWDRREGFSLEYRLERHDGEYRCILDNGRPLVAPDGQLTGYIGSCTDITAQRQGAEQIVQFNRQLQVADRRKDEFLATLAHELRNPLAPLQSGLDLLRHFDVGRDESRETLDMLHRHLQHIIRLVDELLEVARVTEGTIQLQRARLNVAEVVAAALESVQPLIQEMQHRVYLDQPAAAQFVQGDAVRLTQVLTNLLVNAAKYTDPGGKIWLTVRPPLPRDPSSVLDELEPQMVEIAVRDSGIGIEAAMLPEIFEMYGQIRTPHDRSRGGLGIGLMLTSRLVQLHGGSITVQSPGLGQGSTFKVQLPVDESSATPPSGDASQAESESESAALPRVLLVDDNRDAANSLGRLLGVLGQHVRVVHSGRDAIEAIAAFRPDLVVLDLGMPGMDGIETAQRIRDQPGGSRIVFVALTGWGQEQDRQATQQAGFAAHLVKPVNMDLMEMTLNRLLTDRHRAQRAGSSGP